VVAYLFNDYWEDIGTIKSFFEANLALAQQARGAPAPWRHARTGPRQWAVAWRGTRLEADGAW